uniref:Uncharacterized protein n=1 Tax=Rhizophora mucronata TaxID=61149 RepID=A0A2P2QS39_RHIMU
MILQLNVPNIFCTFPQHFKNQKSLTFLIKEYEKLLYANPASRNSEKLYVADRKKTWKCILQ